MHSFSNRTDEGLKGGKSKLFIFLEIVHGIPNRTDEGLKGGKNIGVLKTEHGFT